MRPTAMGMTNELEGRRVAILATVGVERVVLPGGTVNPDKEVVVDQALVSSRRPDDLPAFCATLVELIAHAPQPTATGS